MLCLGLDLSYPAAVGGGETGIFGWTRGSHHFSPPTLQRSGHPPPAGNEEGMDGLQTRVLTARYIKCFDKLSSQCHYLVEGTTTSSKVSSCDQLPCAACHQCPGLALVRWSATSLDLKDSVHFIGCNRDQCRRWHRLLTNDSWLLHLPERDHLNPGSRGTRLMLPRHAQAGPSDGANLWRWARPWSIPNPTRSPPARPARGRAWAIPSAGSSTQPALAATTTPQGDLGARIGPQRAAEAAHRGAGRGGRPSKLGLAVSEPRYWVVESRFRQCLCGRIHEYLSRAPNRREAVALGMMVRVVSSLAVTAVDRARGSDRETKANTKIFRQRPAAARGGRERLQAVVLHKNLPCWTLRMKRTPPCRLFPLAPAGLRSASWARTIPGDDG